MKATVEDVRYAYRLLLGREPDEAGFKHICEWVERNGISPTALAHSIMAADEYVALNSDSGRLREVELHGVRLFPWAGDRLIGDNLDAGGYEPNVLPLFLESLSPGDHVLDIGANVGIFSMTAALRVGPQGKVYAIEPVAKNVRSLCAAIHANGFENVSVIPVAASDRHAVLPILRHADSSNGIVNSKARISDSVEYVPTQRLDELLSQIPRLDVIKMDIEGHEPVAWKGLKGLLDKHRPTIFSEFSPIAMRNSGSVDAETYLADLFEYAGNHIEVLARDGRRIACMDPSSVMREWQEANRALGLNGELHLDLYIWRRN